jgi:hypothetical protein
MKWPLRVFLLAGCLLLGGGFLYFSRRTGPITDEVVQKYFTVCYLVLPQRLPFLDNDIVHVIPLLTDPLCLNVVGHPRLRLLQQSVHSASGFCRAKSSSHPKITFPWYHMSRHSRRICLKGYPSDRRLCAIWVGGSGL